MTSPTKIVPAVETSDSNVGGMTVVDWATPAIDTMTSSKSGSRRIEEPPWE
jgi:hypothetical protein